MHLCYWPQEAIVQEYKLAESFMLILFFHLEEYAQLLWVVIIENQKNGYDQIIASQIINYNFH